MQKIAFYGGSFDPVHVGHLAIATALVEQFSLDKFVFIPAYHAPHKSTRQPTSAYDRYTMLCLATQSQHNVSVSRMEIEMPERPYSVETLSRLTELHPADQIYFVMGADSWQDITTWREWEKVLSLTNHVVVTRPGIEIESGHVTEEIRSRIVDLRHDATSFSSGRYDSSPHIFISDAVSIDISATEIRQDIRSGTSEWKSGVSPAVANYIEKYQIYR